MHVGVFHSVLAVTYLHVGDSLVSAHLDTVSMHGHQATFQNSLIWLPHTVFLCGGWQGAFFIDHVFLFSLAKVLGIQGCIADEMVDILDSWKCSSF